MATQKIALQRAFKKEFGLELWKPRAGGGNSMDGRTARLVFAEPEKFGQLIGMPADLIRDFDALIVALCSGADVSPVEFEGLANSWLDRFHSNPNISWNVLCPTVIHEFY